MYRPHSTKGVSCARDLHFHSETGTFPCVGGPLTGDSWQDTATDTIVALFAVPLDLYMCVHTRVFVCTWFYALLLLEVEDWSSVLATTLSVVTYILSFSWKN